MKMLMVIGAQCAPFLAIMTVEPSSSYLELARNIAKEVFWRFNWDNVSDEVIESWQTSLLNRTF